jgi:hypothetical protein
MGLAFAASVILLAAAGAPDWFVDNTLSYAVPSIVGSPLYLLVGSVLLGVAPRLAAFAVKFSKPENGQG